MPMSSAFSRTAAEVQKALSGRPRSEFSRIAAQVRDVLKGRQAASDRDAEWQRVNSYIADVLKDAHVLYAKLARLQGDFAGAELDNLRKISEAVLLLGDELSEFSKDFYEGKYMMQQSEFTYGEEGGAPIPNPDAGQPQPPPPDEKKGPPPVPVGEPSEGGEEGGGEEGEEGGGEEGESEPETYDQAEEQAAQ